MLGLYTIKYEKIYIWAFLAKSRQKILLEDFWNVSLFTHFFAYWNVNTLEYVGLKLPPQRPVEVDTVGISVTNESTWPSFNYATLLTIAVCYIKNKIYIS